MAVVQRQTSIGPEPQLSRRAILPKLRATLLEQRFQSRVGWVGGEPISQAHKGHVAVQALRITSAWNVTKPDIPGARDRAGNKMAAKIPMIAMTTKSSTSVKPLVLEGLSRVLNRRVCVSN